MPPLQARTAYYGSVLIQVRAMDKDLTTAISSHGLKAYGLRPLPMLCHGRHANATPSITSQATVLSAHQGAISQSKSNQEAAPRSPNDSSSSPFKYRDSLSCVAGECCRSWGTLLEERCLQPISLHDG